MSFLRLPTIGKPHHHRVKRRYSAETLSLAYQEVENNNTSIRKAAKMFGIPDSTLRDRFLGVQPIPQGDLFNINPGPTPTFSKIQEEQLMEHVTYMSDIGYGYSRNEFINLATDFAMSLGLKKSSDPVFAQSWFTCFKKRHPELVLGKPQKLSMVRAECTSDSVLDKYFTSLEAILDEHKIIDKPENIWNIDETGLMMEHTPTKVLCQKGSTPQSITSNKGKNVTIIAGGSAAGMRLPPYYVFPGRRWNPDLLAGACPGATGTVSDSGWSNSTVFFEYLQHHFLKYVPTTGSPVLILFDGHKSHVNLTLREWGKANNIIMFVLPPHTSHVTQPLDVGCFGPLKNSYYSECQSFLRKNPGIHITRLNVAAISSKAYNKALTPDNLISSFRKTGIFPISREQIKPSKTAPSVIYQNKENSQSDCSSELLNETEIFIEPINFLDSKKITVANKKERKRKNQPSLHGSLMSPSKGCLLKDMCTETPKCRPKTSGIKKARTLDLHLEAPRPSTSGIQINNNSCGIPLDYDSDNSNSSEFEDSVPDTDLCCVCKKTSPPAFAMTYTVEFVQWGQCDECNHWTHLKYCSPVRCLRRNASFLCPHCEK